MKKRIILIFACLLIAASMLTACGTPEENFKKATQNFDNFTVEIEEESEGEKSLTVIVKTDNTLKFITCTQSASTTVYIKKDGEKYRLYDFVKKGWSSTGYSETELFGDVQSTESGVIGVLKQSFFDDYTVANNEYIMKDSALASYSKYFGKYETLESFRFKLNGDHFEQATAVTQYGTYRHQYTYKFKDFGKSKVDVE